MKSGRLRSKVTLQSRAETKNSFGEVDNTWSDITTVRASIEPLMGREFHAASGEHSEVTTRIRIRYSGAVGDLRAYDRAVDRSVTPEIVYDIHAVQCPHDEHRELILMCKRDG